jgi:hypothetical protein
MRRRWKDVDNPVMRCSALQTPVTDGRSDDLSTPRIPTPRTSPETVPEPAVRTASTVTNRAKAASHPLFHKATLSRGLIVISRPWR